MQINSETLRKHGYRQIRSEAHAMQLLRREIKHRDKMRQRNGWTYSMGDLLRFRPGVWYALLPGHNYRKTVLIVQENKDASR